MTIICIAREKSGLVIVIPCLPSRPSGFSIYFLLVDDDDDFSSGTTRYPLTLNGGEFEATGVEITGDSYLTFAVLRPVIEFSSTSSNGYESATSVSLEVYVNYPVSENVSVDYATAGGTAEGSGTDYSLPSGTLTISAGDSTGTVSITVVNESIIENDETIIVGLSSPSSNATLGDDSVHTYTIYDNDQTVEVEFVTTGNSKTEANVIDTVGIHLNTPNNSKDVTVDYAITGTATGAGSDYTLSQGTATIYSGDTITYLYLNIKNDALYEANETVVLTLSNPKNANLGTNKVYTFTINDNTIPWIAFTDTVSSFSEANSSVNIPVYLTVASGADVSISYSVTGGTASGNGIDYTLSDGTLTIPAGSTSGNINLMITNDSDIELNETVIIDLSSPTNATIG
ncbi:Calx-beta domain-containing protein, partial [Bacteroidota bacterium]